MRSVFMLLPRGIKVVSYTIMCSAILMYIFFGEDFALCNSIVTITVNQTEYFLFRKQCYLHAVAPYVQLITPPSSAANTKYVKEDNIEKKKPLSYINKHNSF